MADKADTRDAPSENAVTEDVRGQPALDDLMMAMDVVDTLRHDERIVARELAEEDREAELLARLKGIYANQGIEVSDRILRDGVAALKDDRFTYVPPKPSLQVSLAKAYINRGKAGVVLAVCVGLLIAGYAAYHFAVVAPRQQAEREMAEILPAQLQEISTDLSAPDLQPTVAPLVSDVQAALDAEDAEAARAALERLRGVQSEINERYTVQVVNRKGTPAGVYRIPPGNKEARNYYLIVEAIGPDGQPIPRTITSEENGETRTVTTFGVRVPEEVYNEIGADYADDGIIQEDVLGEKSRGSLKVDWAMPVQSGRLLDW